MTKIRVLIVDDDHLTTNIMKLYLEESGYRVVATATNGREAIEKSREIKIDLVLMDIKLGKGMDGIDAAEVINKHMGLPIIFVTAYADKPMLSRAKLTEPAGFINKPLRQKDLQTALEMAASKIKKPTKKRRRKKGKNSVEDVLESLYSLTPAEARVAAKLIEYPQLNIAAEALNISLSTAKTHLKRIYRKTNTNRQSVLVHKIINGPAGLILNDQP